MKSIVRLVERLAARPRPTATPLSTPTPPSLPPLRRAPGLLGLGAASAKGPRKDNQDRVTAGFVEGCALCAIGDGVGGLPHGGEAAGLAVGHAYARLEQGLPAALRASAEGVRALILSAMWDAALRLACEAAATGRLGEGAGFRTTLILVVALEDAYVAGWIGDGGVFVLRRDGEILPLLQPHKHPDAPNLLDASLGPVSEGRPSWAVAPRRPGDLLVAATDGVADAFDAQTAALVREEVARANGWVTGAAESVVGRLGAMRDGRGHPSIGDNITVSILVTP